MSLTLAAFAAGIALGCGAALAESADNGKTAFVKHGCWQCHGFEGQGSSTTSAGRVLYDTKLPFEAFILVVLAFEYWVMRPLEHYVLRWRTDRS